MVGPHALGPASEKLQGAKPPVIERGGGTAYGDLRAASDVQEGRIAGVTCRSTVTGGMSSSSWLSSGRGTSRNNTSEPSAVGNAMSERVTAWSIKSEHNNSAGSHADSGPAL